MARFKTANEILSQVGSEVGIGSTVDAFAEADIAWTQMIDLLNSCGYELLEELAWQGLVREVNFITQAGDTGKYEFPDDYAYMIDQTGWEQAGNVPLFGPLSAQMWTYLIGRDLVSYTIYASFRQVERQFWLFPQPPAEGLQIAYEYISRNWVIDSAVAPNPDVTYDDKVKTSADTVLYEPRLIERCLKYRFLQARGFDTASAESEYLRALQSWGGKDKGAPILNAGRYGYRYPYLDGYRNTPDSNFGTP